MARDGAQDREPASAGQRRSAAACDSLNALAPRRLLLKNAVAAGVALGARRADVWARSTAPGILRFTGWVHSEPSTRDTMRTTLDAFEQIYGVRVEAHELGFGARPEQLLNAEPDVVQLSGNQPRLLGSPPYQFLADLAPLLEEAAELFQEPFPGSVVGGMVDGRHYAVPFTAAPLGFWRNRQALEAAGCDFDDPPQTIDALDKQLTMLKERVPDAYPIRVDFSGVEYSVTRFWPWIWAFGGDPMPDDGPGSLNVEAIDFTGERTVAVFEWLRKLAKDELIMPFPHAWWDRQLFAHGGIGFMMDGPYLTSLISSQNFMYNTREAINAAFGVSLPPLYRQGEPSHPVADFHYLAIRAQSDKQALARKLIRFLTTNDIAIRTFLIPQGGLLPTRKHNTDSRYSASENDAIATTFLEDIAPRMRLPLYGPRYGQAAAHIGDVIRKTVEEHGTINVREQLELLTAQVSEVYTATTRGGVSPRF